MKIRHGFVSNSSTSSFIVSVYHQDLGSIDQKQLLSNDQIQILLDYGFQYTSIRHPSALEILESYFFGTNRRQEIWSDVSFEDIDEIYHESLDKTIAGYRYYYHLGYHVICNQDDVIEFLVKHHIPFTAVVHYGQCSVFYDGEGTDIVRARNYGEEYAMYHWHDTTTIPEFEKSLKPLIHRESHYIIENVFDENTGIE